MSSRIRNMQKDIDFYYKKSRLSQIRGFCSVVQNECSIAKASQKTGVESSAISKQIRTLENDLGTELFDRSGYNKLKMNEEGELFFEEAIKHLNGIDNMFDNFNRSLKNYKNNNIRIAANDIILEKMIPTIYEFKEKYPKVNIVLYNISKAEAEKMLEDKKLDLAFYLEDEDEKLSKNLKQEKISNHVSYWVMCKEHPLADKDEIVEEDLINCEIVVFDNLVFTKSFQNLVSKYKLRPSIKIENGTVNIAIRIIEYSFGITSISEIFLTEDDKKKLTPKIDNILPQRYFYCLTKKNVEQSKKTQEFLKMIKEKHKKIFH